MLICSKTCCGWSWRQLSRKGVGPLSQGRRWFADPITRLLIAHWRRDELTPVSLPAEHYLRAFLKCDDAGDRLLQHARMHWQLRIPSVLVAHALGLHNSVPVPEQEWRRIMGLALGQTVSSAPPAGNNAVTWKRRGESAFADVKHALLKPWEDQKKHLCAKFQAKQRAAANIEILLDKESRQSGRQVLLRWCLHMLNVDLGRKGRGYAPSTIEQNLRRLIEHLFDAGDMPTSWEGGALVARYEERLDRLPPGGQRNGLVSAIRHFHRFACGIAPALPPLPKNIGEYATPTRASANLVIPEECRRAITLCGRGRDSDDLKLCLLLAFRAGLRLPEILGLTVDDYFEDSGRTELVVVRNRHRDLKTLTSRRILPLDMLLTTNELKLLRKRVEERRAAVGHASRLLFGPLGLSRPLGERMVSRKLEAILLSATGTRTTVHHLRHSFASYLLTTLLLPREEHGHVPRTLRAVISPERRDRLADRILGSQKLGQHAVHVVSHLMGHIISGTTLRWYSHLLDLSLCQHVSRGAVAAGLPKHQIRALTGQARLRAPLSIPDRTAKSDIKSYQRPVLRPDCLDQVTADRQLWQVPASRGRAAASLERTIRYSSELQIAPKRRPLRARRKGSGEIDWRLLLDVAHWPDSEVDKRAREFRVQTADALRWRGAHQNILALKTKAGVQRHRILGSDVTTRSAKWFELVDRHWCKPRSLRSVERRALTYALSRWDEARCGVRFRSRKLALAWRDLLRAHGFAEEQISLSISGRFSNRSSEELHAELAGDPNLPGTAVTRGRRGTIFIGFCGGSDRGEARHVRSAAQFVCAMIGIREGISA